MLILQILISQNQSEIFDAFLGNEEKANIISILLKEYSKEFKDMKLVGITGTNGKTTTTTLIYEFIKEQGLPVHLAGNIGYPLCSFIDKLKDNDIIIDLSHKISKSGCTIVLSSPFRRTSTGAIIGRHLPPLLIKSESVSPQLFCVQLSLQVSPQKLKRISKQLVILLKESVLKRCMYSPIQ